MRGKKEKFFASIIYNSNENNMLCFCIHPKTENRDKKFIDQR